MGKIKSVLIVKVNELTYDIVADTKWWCQIIYIFPDEQVRHATRGTPIVVTEKSSGIFITWFYLYVFVNQSGCLLL